MASHTVSIIWYAVVALVLANLLYGIVKNRGLKGAMFGAPVTQTVGEIDLGRRGPLRTKLRVHTLDPRDATTPRVGLELVTTSLMSFSARGVPLTSEQARELGKYLSAAAS